LVFGNAGREFVDVFVTRALAFEKKRAHEELPSLCSREGMFNWKDSIKFWISEIPQSFPGSRKTSNLGYTPGLKPSEFGT